MTWHVRPSWWRAVLVPVALLGLITGFVAARAAQDEAPPAAPKPAPEAKAPRPTTPSKTRTARGAAKQKTSEFVRFIEEDDDGGGRLEAAIVTYRNAAGVTVHLVAALHVGEGSYYDGLNETFKTYDALLYEMVKPRGSAAPRPGVKSGGMVSGFQRFLKDVLELEFQLDRIDYSAPNFVHADLDAEKFFALQKERGESIFTLMFRSMLSEMQRQAAGTGAPPITIFDLLAAMNSPDSARQYKLLLARQFQDIESQIAGVEGEEGTVLVTERNKAALKVLKEQVELGRKNIGVFYGAGHMRGLEDALVGEMGFRRTGIEWRVAWDMRGPGPTTKPAKPPAEIPGVRPARRAAGAPGTQESAGQK